MSNLDSHGVQLSRFLEKEWDSLYTTRGAWCRKVGLADSTVYRWSQGVEPDLPNLMLVAEGLGRSLTEILYHAGYPVQIKAQTVAPARERVDLAQVIKTEPDLTDVQRKALLAVHAALATPMPARGKRTVRVAGAR